MPHSDGAPTGYELTRDALDHITAAANADSDSDTAITDALVGIGLALLAVHDALLHTQGSTDA